MPTDTQREPTPKEYEAAGEEVQRLIRELRGACYDPEANDQLDVDALIIAIAKRVREAEGDVGVAIIAAERHRQMEREGYTLEHDDTHTYEEMASCAACYAMPAECRRLDDGGTPVQWPFGCCDWKPTPQDRIRELAKAGALIAAEIGRLHRLEAPHA